MKDTFGETSIDAELSHEDVLRQKMFSYLNGVFEIRGRFQQVLNLTKKYGFLRPKIIFGADNEFNFHQAPLHTDRAEFKLKCMCLWSFVASAELENQLTHSGSLDLLIFLTTVICDTICETSFSKSNLIKN
nr:unnamed protein product [Callosobruchus analis]